MRASTEWVASLLMAGWERQEAEGRYRGPDEFRALHVDPKDAVASWRAAVAPAAPWPVELRDWFEEWSSAWAEADRLGLGRAEVFVAAVAVAVEDEPRLRPLVAALTDDPATRLPTVGLACELAGAAGLDPAAVRSALAADGRLAWYDVARATPVEGRPSRLDDLLTASAWLVDGVDGEPGDLVRTRPRAVPGAAGAGRAGGERVPIAVGGADHVRHAEAVGESVGAPRAVLLRWRGEPDAGALGRAARAAVLGGCPLVVAVDEPPEPWLAAAVARLGQLGCDVAVSLEAPARWVAPPAWRTLECGRLTAGERAARWAEALTAGGALFDRPDLVPLAAEFALGAAAIDDAATRAALGATAGLAAPARLGLADLRAAARRTAWRDLSSVARPGPRSAGWEELVVPDAVRRQLLEIAGAIANRGHVLDQWGFGGRAGSRGYHLLFAGPSGTGKTLTAGVLARAAGLDLWVVDLARVVDKYLGETEKQLDRVLRAAEATGAMLLFDEADALFGRRGEVREARDRWANVEIAYLLQRIEDHDGVTVLTTNVSHHLDEAFARRMSRRVEFAIPDATLRRRLWRRSVPPTAPGAEAGDLATVADRFELAGGAIRTAALNAAYEAAAAGAAIDLGHLVRASVGELAKAGRTPTRAELAELAPLLASRRP